MHALLVIDGVCNFCNGLVNWVIDHEPKGKVHFVAAQDPKGEKILRKYGIREYKSLVLIHKGNAVDQSSAFLHLLGYLKLPWSLGKVFLICPRFIRDLIYQWFSSHRYQWFGRTSICRRPSPRQKKRFL